MAGTKSQLETARSPLTQPKLQPQWPRILLDRGEVFFALLFTGIIVCVHGVRMADAGGLWRDEAGAVQLATMPSFKDVISNFPHEAFPLLFPATVRAYAALSGGGDAAWRFFGFLVGIGVIGALWWNLWVLRRGVPLLSLALLGFNAAFVQLGDSMRGYGLGTLLMLITVGLVWRVLEKPSARRVAAAALCAVASVQCLFQNSPLLLAICVGAAIVALAGGSRRTAGLVLGIGLLAAFSLLPYWGALQRARNWDVIIRDDTSSEGILSKLQQTLSASDEGSWRVWAMLALYGMAIAVWAQLRSKPSSGSNGLTFAMQNSFLPQRAILLLSCLTLVVAVPAYFVFLDHLGYPPRPWYYIALMGLGALLLDILAGSVGSPPLSRERKSTGEAGEHGDGAHSDTTTELAARRCQNSQARTPALRSAAVSAASSRGVPAPCSFGSQAVEASGRARGDGANLPTERQTIIAWLRFARVALALLIAGNCLLPTWRQVRVRQTNVDLLAARLNQLAAKDDLVVVAPWFKGISFYRYYHGAAPWMTVPPLDFQKFHRYDLIKNLMTMPDQGQVVRPLLLRIQSTLKSGHKVWTVGVTGLVPPGGDTSAPPPAPSAGWGWQNAKYANRWTGMTVAYLQACARHNEKIQIGYDGQVSEFENLPLRVFEGWSGL